MDIWKQESDSEMDYYFDDSRLRLPSVRIRDVLLDYQLFKAARALQLHIRGWLCRKRFLKQRAAVTTISRWFRGYICRKKRFLVIQEDLQATLLAYYIQNAVKTQAFYRGWRYRLHIHDVRALTTMQLNAAQDVINCVAYQLHTLLREQKLPGVYSLRSTNCQRKVEELLSTLVLRFLNGRRHSRIAERRQSLLNARKEFRNSLYHTFAPFRGPSDCIDAIVPQSNKDMDVYMARVVALYEEARRDLRIQNTRKAASRKRKLQYERDMKIIRDKDFCNDIFKGLLL
ncbi:uncharacterized protein [Drosophila tropicalis]|uniref:uncharacterized protein n=1 Tax=Drosophila tropicalis TaxID=46794 RepID=UPI0035ABA349